MDTRAAQLQAFLFAEGGSVSRKRLMQLLGVTAEDLNLIATTLQAHLASGGGLQLITTDTEIALVISGEASRAVIDAQSRELNRDIGDAGLEVLSIILYRGPSTRAHIDFIRGVNTSSTVRNLLTRGLIERTGNPADGREFLYRPTAELLAHLGVTSVQELPDYATISSELANFEQSSAQHTHAESADTMHDGGSL